jgi:hypothetical protein
MSEVARRLRVRVTTRRAMIWRGAVPVVRFGRTVRVYAPRARAGRPPAAPPEAPISLTESTRWRTLAMSLDSDRSLMLDPGGTAVHDAGDEPRAGGRSGPNPVSDPGRVDHRLGGTGGHEARRRAGGVSLRWASALAHRGTSILVRTLVKGRRGSGWTPRRKESVPRTPSGIGSAPASCAAGATFVEGVARLAATAVVMPWSRQRHQGAQGDIGCPNRPGYFPT